ncbi:acyltransferase family protein [Pseudarthrobacter sp. NKDBFgelt]|uniref:acyltransferase family protein n=1 Tax=Pseudarthrobacter sp. NKDBFgelt TaxID=3384443 RepID=UPI0038D359CD
MSDSFYFIWGKAVPGVTAQSKKADKKPQGPDHFRFDIQGLRAIAVGIVVLYHAGVPWLPGGFVGVDVFFVISGFLITSGLVRELRNKGRISLMDFYARRAARILPAATVAILGTLGLVFTLLPPTRWVQAGNDAAASALYYVNWLFANSAVDYLARDQAPSPFQHFWSLAVEEQFYIVWPLLLVLVGWLAYRYGKSRQKAVIIAFAVIALPSFVWSIYMTATNPGGAYFATTSRMWELAIGAGLAIGATTFASAPKAVAAVLGWAGLGAIAAAAITFNHTTPFPSYTALLPTLGAAAIIWAGQRGGSLGPAALLQVRPMVWVGELSYSLYLWHWPLLVIAAAVIGPLSLWGGLAVAALSLVPAWLSLRFIEKPVLVWVKDQHMEGAALKIGGLLSLSGVTAATLLIAIVPPTPPASSIQFVPKTIQSEGAVAPPVGAEVLFRSPGTPTAVDSFASITPSALTASKDVAAANNSDCTQSELGVEALKCSYGDFNSTKVLALVGDSHAAMLVPGLERVAKDNGWRIDAYTKGSCPFTKATVVLDGRPYSSCREWADNVTVALEQSPPQMIVSAMSRRYAVVDANGRMLGTDASVNPLAAGLSEAWQPLLDKGVTVVSIRDIPRPDVLVPDCVAQNERNLTKCSWKKSDILPEESAETVAVTNTGGAHLLDLTNAVCPEDVCPAVVGGVLIYRDGNHLTATYAETMHEHMAASLIPLLA